MVQKRNVFVFREGFANNVQLFARRLVFRVFLHGVELPGDIRHHRENVIASLDAGRREEAFRKSFEIGFAEHDRSVGL